MPLYTSTQLEALKPAEKPQDLTIEKLGSSKGCLILRVLPGVIKSAIKFPTRYIQ